CPRHYGRARSCPEWPSPAGHRAQSREFRRLPLAASPRTEPVRLVLRLAGAGPAPEQPERGQLAEIAEPVVGVPAPTMGRGLPADKLRELLRQAAPSKIQRARAPPMS